MSRYIFVVFPYLTERNGGITVIPADQMSPAPIEAITPGTMVGTSISPNTRVPTGRDEKIFEEHRPPHFPQLDRSSGQCIKPSGMRGSALPGPARTFRPLPVVLVHLRVSYPAQLQAMAEILAVCRLGDEPRSASAEQSQSVFASGIDVKHFLQIEDVAISLICPSRDAKELPGPQAGQSALENEGL